ncbi:hypothetical protein E0H46_30430 [Rhizobium leguminosarum bv. viciae]|nr:hypothetical protein E0H46_30430 [Rhizobium leguminosarum bv. viciae]
MRRGTIIGFILLAVLTAWIGRAVLKGDFQHPFLPSAAIGSGFEGDLALPKSEIEAKLNNARERVLATMDRAYTFRIASRIAAWLAFLATAAITLVAGWYGQMPAAPPPGTASGAATTAGLPQRTARVVTLLAALAAVLTAGGGLATQEAESLSTQALAHQRDLTDARKQVLETRSAEVARTALDDLALHLRQ